MSNEGAKQDLLINQSNSASPLNFPCDLAVRLKLIRETLGISQRELAKRAGVTNSSISMIELGQVSPSIQSLERILSAIPINLSDFFGFRAVSAVRVARSAKESAQLFCLAEDDSRTVNQGDQLFSRSIEISAGSAQGLESLAYDISGVVTVGKAHLKSIGITYSLVAGDSFYIPARQLHQFMNSDEIPLKLFVCSLFVHSR